MIYKFYQIYFWNDVYDKRNETFKFKGIKIYLESSDLILIIGLIYLQIRLLPFNVRNKLLTHQEMS